MCTNSVYKNGVYKKGWISTCKQPNDEKRKCPTTILIPLLAFMRPSHVLVYCVALRSSIKSWILYQVTSGGTFCPTHSPTTKMPLVCLDILAQKMWVLWTRRIQLRTTKKQGIVLSLLDTSMSLHRPLKKRDLVLHFWVAAKSSMFCLYKSHVLNLLFLVSKV